MVSARLVEPGTTIVAGQAVVQVIDPATLWVKARIDQGQAGGVRAGQPAEIVLRSDATRIHRGEVQRIDWVSDAVTEERIVNVGFAARPEGISVGELVEVTIRTAELADVRSVPAAALKRLDRQDGVWQHADGRVAFRPVRVGITTLDGRSEIQDGPGVGDEVIIRSFGFAPLPGTAFAAAGQVSLLGELFASGAIFVAVPPGVSPVPVLASAAPVPSLKMLDDSVRFARENAAARRDFRDIGLASNAWGIGADLSENGKGVLLANPHFPYTGTRRFYEMQVTVPDYYNVHGATLIGMPILALGFNKHLGWSHTVSTAKRFTMYELTLDATDPQRLTYAQLLEVFWQAHQPTRNYGGRQYLNAVFTYAGSASLARELTAIADPSRVRPGDVFIRGGFPGHAVLVADVAENTAGERVFLLVQSYMPAQDIHVLTNPGAPGSAWYPARKNGSLETPEWTFSYTELRRFPEADKD